MADAILKRFLVQLDVDVSGRPVNQFIDSLKLATAEVIKWSVAIAAAVTTIVIAVERAAARFDDLNWAAKHIGTTAKELHAIKYAAGQTGSTPEFMQASLEAFAIKMR